MIVKTKKIIESNIDIKIINATLLSVEEAVTLLTKQERTYKNWWWLRSPGLFSGIAAYVLDGGYGNDYGCNVSHSSGCVRPALNIDISNSDIKVGDTFEFGGKEFKVISDTLAWMHKDDIGTTAFRTDYRQPDANIYEVSDIKKFVDKWFAANCKENT